MEPGTEVHNLPLHSPIQGLPVPPRSLPVFRSDVLVVGSGIAGLRAAIAAGDLGAHVVVLSKGALDDTNTRYAQGGIAAAMGPGDCPEFHAGDTLNLGCGLSDPAIVEALTSEAPQAIRWLLREGTRFDRQPDGALAMGREGGHREPRVLHSHGTATGLEIQRVLCNVARNHPRLDIHPFMMAVDLVKDAEGRVCGLLAIHQDQGRRGPGVPEPVFFEAQNVIFATGGGGQIYRETTNPQQATGDGLAMALRAGTELQDLEFVQFHPTILYLAGAARFLISEVTRGAGAVLRDRSGRAFMADYHPDRELAPRDVVSRAIFDRMIKAGDTHVYLDFSGVPDAPSRFPALAKITREFGIDFSQHPIPVRPAVHYFVGGITADLEGRTSIEGLWATGECASIRFHGANRMGSNSLLEGLVHGRRVGEAVASSNALPWRRFLLPRTDRPQESAGAELQINDMVYSLKSLMWRQVGIVRDLTGLQDASGRLQEWEGYLARLGPFSQAGVEVVNMVQVAHVLTLAATFRQESRGTHSRTDYPETLDPWRVHSSIRNCTGTVEIKAQPVSYEAASAQTESAAVTKLKSS
ncbi:MAG: L-aspartate oxidase [Planctomycetota bacterium]|nr:MAG: L-aspartate oxidase [Planctomycetota bacterium]